MNENELSGQAPVTPLPHIIKRRRNLLSWWVIGFTWMFLLFFAAIPVAIVFALFKRNFQLSLLGLSTNDPFSAIGIFLMLLFAFKSIIAFMLWTEKKQAVLFAKIDAIISSLICCAVMVYVSITLTIHLINFRLELIVIIPYFLKMQKIQHDWEHFNDTETGADVEQTVEY